MQLLQLSPRSPGQLQPPQAVFPLSPASPPLKHSISLLAAQHLTAPCLVTPEQSLHSNHCSLHSTSPLTAPHHFSLPEQWTDAVGQFSTALLAAQHFTAHCPNTTEQCAQMPWSSSRGKVSWWFEACSAPLWSTRATRGCSTLWTSGRTATDLGKAMWVPAHHFSISSPLVLH